ncbi:MAG: CPBP family intramembrane glutamic endopeptidase [Flavobacterium sp.]
MFLSQAHKPNNPFINYIIGLILIFISWQLIGSIPLFIAIGIKVFKDNIPFPKDEMAMFTILDSNLFLTLIIFGFIAGLICLYLVVKHLHQMTWLKITTSRPKVDYKRIAFAFVIWALFTSISKGIEIYLTPENYQFHFKPIPFFILLIISIFLLPFQTSFEEYFFRGYLMQGLGILFKNKFLPLFITSVLFGLMHLFNPEVEKLGNLIMIYYIGMGFFLGIITLMDDGLELALGVHAANNMVTALLLTADWTALQTNSIYRDISKDPKLELIQVVPLILVFFLYIYIFSKKYQWNNWKDKLMGKITITTNN